MKDKTCKNIKTNMFVSELESLCVMVWQGEQILTIAVMAILITAPLGAAAIMLTGPRLLHHDTTQDTEKPQA